MNLSPELEKIVEDGAVRLAELRAQKLASDVAEEAKKKAEFELAWSDVYKPIVCRWPFLAPYLPFKEFESDARWPVYAMKNGTLVVDVSIPGFSDIVIELDYRFEKGTDERIWKLEGTSPIVVFEHVIKHGSDDYYVGRGDCQRVYGDQMHVALALAREFGQKLPEMEREVQDYNTRLAASRIKKLERAEQEPSLAEQLADLVYHIANPNNSDEI